ncbi:MAG: class I SAM-dependent methyltransferase, partial [Deltaproteobacteria bacterium]|nr:class I SAM-dependent methyltransferase [Deltaproteobacteria bacterium]
MTHPQERLLKQGALSLGLHFSAQQYNQLCAYIDALLKWNRVYNLSALHDEDEIAVKHILDSLTVVSPLHQ